MSEPLARHAPPSRVLTAKPFSETARDSVLMVAYAISAWLASLLTGSPYHSAAACFALFFVVAAPTRAVMATRGGGLQAADIDSHPLSFPGSGRRGQGALSRPKAGTRRQGRSQRASAPPAAVDWRTAVTEADLEALRTSLGSSHEQGWEEVLSRDAPGIQYTAWRRPAPCGGGLSEWKATTVFTDIAASDLAAFHLDATARQEWDTGVERYEQLDVAPPPQQTQHKAGDDAALSLQFWRMAFPAPFASRDYVCARRVWRAPSSGDSNDRDAVFVVSKVPAGPLPGTLEDALPMGRTHRVQTYFSGARVRPLPSGGSELMTLYYEDSGISPGMVEWAVRRSLWSFVEKQAQALHQYTTHSSGHGAGPSTDTGAQPARLRLTRTSSGRRGIRSAVRRIGSVVLTYASAIGRSVVAAALAAENPDVRAARRQQRAQAAQARRALRAKTGVFDPVASIVGNMRGRIRVGESIKRRATAALHAGSAHIVTERARRQLRDEQEQAHPRAHARTDPAAALRGKMLMIAAAVAFKVLQRPNSAAGIRETVNLRRR